MVHIIERPFQVIRDGQGFAKAIAVDGRHILQLQVGATLNERWVSSVVDVLNAAISCVNNLEWSSICDEDVVLEQALQDLVLL